MTGFPGHPGCARRFDSTEIEAFQHVGGSVGPDSSVVHNSSIQTPSVCRTPVLVVYGINTVMSGDSDQCISLSPNGSTPYSAVDFMAGYPTHHLMDVHVCVPVCALHFTVGAL